MQRQIVLLVDDEPLILAMIEFEFRDAGFDIRTATDAADALAIVDRTGSELSALVTDIQLGEGPNGWALAVDVRTRLPDLPLVYITGDSAADWSAYGTPKSILIQKPFVGAEVLTAVMTLRNASSQTPSA